MPQQVDYATLAKKFGGAAVSTETPAPPPQPEAAKEDPSLLSQAGAVAKDVAIGAAKGLGNTVFGLGKVFHDYTPVGRLSDAIHPGAFDERPPELAPTNTAQRVGYTAEQVGEFFVPGGAVARAAHGSRAARAGLEAATSGGLSVAQGATNPEAAATAGLSAAVPFVGKAVGATSRALTRSAEKNVAQALGATKEAMKDTAAKIAPEMLERGVKGSRETMLDLAKSKVTEVGKGIENEIAIAVQQGKTVAGQSVQAAIAQSRTGLMVADAAGNLRPIPGTEAVLRRLDKLDQFVASLGPDIPFDKAAKIKTVWDRIVSKAGLYGPKAASSATDSADAWAIREAAGSFRQLIATGSATLDDLNGEYAFWKGLKDVLKETARRTQSQGGGLVSGIGGVAGATAGVATGDSVGDKMTQALVYGAAGRQLIRMMQSPAWRTSVSAPLKASLANALASGSVGGLLSAMARISSAAPAQMRGAPAQ